MSRVSCRIVDEARLDPGELNTGSSPAEPDWVAAHLEECSDCRQSERIWSFVQTQARTATLPPLSPFQERRLIAGRYPAHFFDEPRKHNRRLRWGLAVAAAAAIAVLLFSPLDRLLGDRTQKNAPQLQSTSHRIADLPLEQKKSNFAANRQLPVYLFSEGSVANEIRVLDAGDNVELFLSPETQLTVLAQSESLTRLSLETGLIAVDIGPVLPGFRFVVETEGYLVEARGTVFAVEVERHGPLRVHVTEGKVEVRSKSNAVQANLVTAGFVFERGEVHPTISEFQGLDGRELLGALRRSAHIDDSMPIRAAKRRPKGQDNRPIEPADGPRRHSDSAVQGQLRPVVEPSLEAPAALLREAQQLRQRGSFKAAAITYGKLIQTFPDSNSATVALVALGQLRLKSLGQPRRAIALFDRYLRQLPDGTLSSAARLGNVRAFAALEQPSDLIDAAGRYLEKHPRGTAIAEVLRRRGEAYVAQRACPRALDDFDRVVHTWPDSAEAIRARKAGKRCSEIQ